jgi:subtilisin-like proprotein convertase family protein
MPASGANDPSIDTRVTGAWNRDLTGTGVVIGIVDDAIQVGHPDLAPNVRTDLSRYFLPDGSSQSDPSPAPESGSNHGTAVAGIAAARGGNGIGGTGAAPLAGLAGIRTELDGTALLNAYTWHNGDIQIKNHSYGTTDRYEDASAFAALLNSTAADPSHPVIHVFAAGNGRNQATDDANTSMLANAPGVIAVAALGSNGKFASYSSFGASVFVTAPSNSSSGFFGTATTDRTGSAGYNVSGFQNYSNLDYTNNFGGTSSAAPLASGIIALAVQARNDAGYATDVRVIRHLLAMTSRVVDTGDSTPTSDGGWRTNAAGFHFNQNYGFGLIDADALTRAAVQYSGVTPQVSYTKSATVAAAIPDVDLTGISRTFTVANSPGKLEEVLVTLHVTHALPGQLRVSITSPSHYTSRLVGASNASTPANLDWTFETLAFWGEGVNGDWTITVSDQIPGTVGTWDSYSVTFNTGELIPVPEPAEVLVVAAVALGIGAGLRRGRKLRAGPAAAIAP